MPLQVVVQAATHLVRQPIAQSLSALGISVREFTDLGEVVARMNDLSPDLIVMDADGMAHSGAPSPPALGARGAAWVSSCSQAGSRSRTRTTRRLSGWRG